jgi:hypothetical protein
VDSPNSLEVFVSTNFDGLNVTKATWIPLKVILPKQATPWYQFVGSGGVTYLLTREKSISLSGTPAREKIWLWTALFRWMMYKFSEVWVVRLKYMRFM